MSKKYMQADRFSLKKLSQYYCFARLCLYLHPFQQLSSFRAPTLWFIDLTVATCYIQNTFLSLYQFFHEKMDKTRNTRMVKNGCRQLLGMQSINTEIAYLRFSLPRATKGNLLLSSYEITVVQYGEIVR